MILTSDVLVFIASAFYAVAVTAGIAGRFPVDFMAANPRKVSVPTSVGAVIAGVGWSFTFHPALLVASGGLAGVTFITEVAGNSPVDFMDAPHPRQIATTALAAGAVTTIALFIV